MHSSLMLFLLLRATALAPAHRAPAAAAHQRPRTALAAFQTEANPDAQRIITCGNCKAVYPIDIEDLGERGSKVKCEVCGNVWFQSTGRVNSLFDGFELAPSATRAGFY